MIKTRIPSITPEQIRSIQVRPGEMLHASVNVGSLPPKAASEFLDRVRNFLLSHLPEGTNLLVTSDQITFTVVQQP